MLRRHALAALPLGAVAAAAACRDALDPTRPDARSARGGRADVGRASPGDLEDAVTHHTITGGGGCRLHVVEAGNPRGRAILFLHGFSQSWLTWDAQLGSELARRYRLVAMDLRGHGGSDRPREGYADTRMWADDVDAVMRALSLERPVLSGWSYGPIVMLDYLRHYGAAGIGGLHFVAGISKLGTAEAVSVLTPELLALVPGFFSTDAETSVAALQSLLRLCFARTPSEGDLYTMLGYNAAVPPYVRQALFARTVDNDDLLATLHTPVLITHGALDAVVRLEVVEQHQRLLPAAEVDIMPGAGHAPFRDDPAAFNRRLARFVDAVASHDAPQAVGALH